jgi:tryptophan 2,3-dioxygenase
MAAWRRRHVGVVQVMIGRTMGTGGSSGARYLQESMDRRFLPEVWAARQLAMEEAQAAASRS